MPRRWLYLKFNLNHFLPQRSHFFIQQSLDCWTLYICVAGSVVRSVPDEWSTNYSPFCYYATRNGYSGVDKWVNAVCMKEAFEYECWLYVIPATNVNLFFFFTSHIILLRDFLEREVAQECHRSRRSRDCCKNYLLRRIICSHKLSRLRSRDGARFPSTGRYEKLRGWSVLAAGGHVQLSGS